MIQRYLIALCLCLTACQSAKKKDGDNGAAGDGPKLTKPVVRKVWVPPAIEEDGKIYRDGHFIYILDKETVWSR